jgi:hypothetical protein
MFTEILYLNGYGQFVWPAFLFTFVSCSYLYVKTKDELQEQEKIFLKKFNKLSSDEITLTEKKKVAKEVLSNSFV